MHQHCSRCEHWLGERVWAAFRYVLLQKTLDISIYPFSLSPSLSLSFIRFLWAYSYSERFRFLFFISHAFLTDPWLPSLLVVGMYLLQCQWHNIRVWISFPFCLYEAFFTFVTSSFCGNWFTNVKYLLSILEAINSRSFCVFSVIEPIRFSVQMESFQIPSQASWDIWEDFRSNSTLGWE